LSHVRNKQGFTSRGKRLEEKTPMPLQSASHAPSGRMIDAVLRFADIQEEIDERRTRLRLSRQRLRQPEVKAALGQDARRASKLSVIFDEQEAEIVEVANDPEPEDGERWLQQLERAYERRTWAERAAPRRGRA
jgi:hypothetical protein